MTTRTSLPPDLVVEKLTAKTAPPPMFKVILLNDDYTPMEFVVHKLEKVVGRSSEDAPKQSAVCRLMQFLSERSVGWICSSGV